jgi:type IV secretory pathway TraG/TraD family ATPase VirD4
MKIDDLKLEWQRGRYDNAKLHDLLGHWIYQDQTITDLAKPELWGGLGMFLVSLLVVVPKDVARARARKHGRRLKGPELVTPRQFNRRTRSGGISFVQQQSLKDKTLRKKRWVGIRRDIESSHILVMGDSGKGKSALIRQILLQIEERGETAIVYDPATPADYLPYFFSRSRGDLILNPLDQRMPYWTPGDELRQGADALTLAASLFPDRPNENSFFVEAPRKIFAHLLGFHPTPQELVWWMSHPEEIDRRVKGTEYAAMIDRDSPPQRNGVLGSLNMVADAMKMLPSETETKQRWSTLEWSKERRGWLFLTSTPDTRKRLAPLISLWLDILVLRLMNQGRMSPRPVWFILDELATLQRLPQLHTAITENRKSNNPVVLGFQGRSQLEVRYGHEAEAMMSQPSTKLFLSVHRSSE